MFHIKWLQRPYKVMNAMGDIHTKMERSIDSVRHDDRTRLVNRHSFSSRNRTRGIPFQVTSCQICIGPFIQGPAQLYNRDNRDPYIWGILPTRPSMLPQTLISTIIRPSQQHVHVCHETRTTASHAASCANSISQPYRQICRAAELLGKGYL